MGKDSFYGLEQYFQQEGFAFRLVPVKTPASGYRDFGMVNTDIMYSNLMQKFEWGGYENPDLWMDENNQRFITNIRFTFVRLAEALIAEGKRDQALEVLDRVSEVAVHDNFSYNGSILPIAEAYLKAGNNEAGVNMLRKLVENESEYLIYYMDQDSEDMRRLGQKMQQSIGLIGQSTLLVTQNYPQSTEIQTEFNDIYRELAAEYQSLR
jgi:tetratricopeptide (TPR) repeat protein